MVIVTNNENRDKNKVNDESPIEVDLGVDGIQVPEKEILVPRQFVVVFLNDQDRREMQELRDTPSDDPKYQSAQAEYNMKMCFTMSVESLHIARTQQELLAVLAAQNDDIIKQNEAIIKELKQIRGETRELRRRPKSEWERSIMSN